MSLVVLVKKFNRSFYKFENNDTLISFTNVKYLFLFTNFTL